MRTAPVELVNASAIIVTRGDQDLTPILDSLPKDWQILFWDNGAGECREWTQDHAMWVPSFRWDASDLSVYGRYAAIEHANGDLIYVQDDDCVVSEPRELLHRWVALNGSRYGQADHLVANMPQPFRAHYTDSCLVGFGAVFHRDAPERAFGRFNLALDNPFFGEDGSADYDFYRRDCDIVFTALTPRVLVDVPYENLPWATADDRLYRQPEHMAKRTRMLELARKVRDAG